MPLDDCDMLYNRHCIFCTVWKVQHVFKQHSLVVIILSVRYFYLSHGFRLLCLSFHFCVPRLVYRLKEPETLLERPYVLISYGLLLSLCVLILSYKALTLCMNTH